MGYLTLTAKNMAKGFSIGARGFVFGRRGPEVRILSSRPIFYCPTDPNWSALWLLEREDRNQDRQNSKTDREMPT